MAAMSTGSVFNVDLNDVRDHNRLVVLRRQADGFVSTRLEAGDWVRLRDEDGNFLDALIDVVDGRRLRLKIDWGSWVAAGHDLTSASVYGAAVGVGGPISILAS